MTWQWTCRRLRQARRLLAHSLRVANLQQARASYDSAAALLEQALELARGEAAAELQVEPLTMLGNVRRLQGRHRDAETCLLRARALTEHARLPGWRQARVLNGLALIHKDSANYDEAATLYHQALTAFRRHCGLDHYEVAVNLGTLGHCTQRPTSPTRPSSAMTGTRQQAAPAWARAS